MDARPDEHAPLLILFDGHCVLCNGWADFIARRDSRQRFQFATLQSPLGQHQLEAAGIPDSARLDSVVLLEAGRVWQRSSAALRVLRQLRWPWPLLYGLILLPRPLRDALYDFVGRHRYRWFGRHPVCGIHSEQVRQRVPPGGE